MGKRSHEIYGDGMRGGEGMLKGWHERFGAWCEAHLCPPLVLWRLEHLSGQPARRGGGGGLDEMALIRDNTESLAVDTPSWLADMWWLARVAKGEIKLSRMVCDD